MTTRRSFVKRKARAQERLPESTPVTGLLPHISRRGQTNPTFTQPVPQIWSEIMSAFEFALRDLHTGHRTILSYGQNIIVEDSDGGIAARSMKSSEDGTNLASIRKYSICKFRVLSRLMHPDVELGRAYMTITSIMNQLAVRPSSNEPLSEAQVAWYNSRLQTLAGHGNERMMELRPDDCIMVVGTKHRWTLEVQLLSESGHAPTHQVNAETLNQAAGSPTSSFPLDGLFKATKSMNPEHRTIAGSEMRIRAVQALEIQESDNAEIAGDNHELKTANGENLYHSLQFNEC